MSAENSAHAERVAAVHELTVERFPSTVAELASLVRIPSVSWDAFDPAEVRASAEHIAELARETGFFHSVRIEQAELEPGVLGQPAVLAHRPAEPGFPHVVLYAHHDVQPPGDAALWTSAAYEPTLRDDRLYGRGSSDDKAGVVTHLAAVRALQTLGGEPRIGVTLFVEGEEENGSRSFAQFLHDHRAELAGDVIVVCDSDNVDTEQPALTVALRGNVTFRMTVRTLEHANHSGMFGGAVPDALMALIRLINGCWNENGSVAIPGLTSADLGPGIPYDEAQLRLETGLIAEPIGAGSLTDRMWAQPTVTVTGIDVPSVAEASNTLIPAVSARVSVRVAPGQSPQAAWDAVRSFLEKNAPWGSELSFDDIDLGSPFLVDASGAHFAAMEAALTDGWGVAPARIGIGGSIPFIATLAEAFPSAEIVVTAVGDPLSQPHSPNESQHLGVLRKAIASESLFLLALNSAE